MGIPHITISTAVTLTGLSKRTLWRRIADGLLRKIATDKPEDESLLVVEDVLQLSKLDLSEAERDTLLHADRGDAAAQLALALFFLRHARPDAAANWFARAAEQGETDAMHWLGSLYAQGEGVEADATLAAEWISKAASRGHPIAKAQVAAIFPHPQP